MNLFVERLEMMGKKEGYIASKRKDQRRGVLNNRLLCCSASNQAAAKERRGPAQALRQLVRIIVQSFLCSHWASTRISFSIC